MRTRGYIVSPARMGVLVFGAALFAACAYGVDPDRSGLEPGAGGASGGVGPGGATSSSADAVSSSANSTSASSTSASSTSASSSTSDAASSSASSTSASTGTGGAPPDGLRVQYKAAEVNAMNNQIKPHFNIVNGGTTPVAIGELSIRYYYTLEPNGSQTEVFQCDYALMGCGKLTGKFVPTTGTNADHYLEITFPGAGTDMLQPGAQTGEMQARYNKSDYSTLNQANDYSFDPTKTAFTDWDKVTLYQNGTLVWGIEP